MNEIQNRLEHLNLCHLRFVSDFGFRVSSCLIDLIFKLIADPKNTVFKGGGGDLKLADIGS
jgi:hypothetical protein